MHFHRALALLAPVALATTTLAQQPAPARTLASVSLTVTPPALDEIAETASAGAVGAWKGRVGPSQVSIRVLSVAAPKSGFAEPEDVAESVRADQWKEFDKSPESGSQRLSFQPLEVVTGKFGSAPHGAIVCGERVPAKGGAALGLVLIAAGLLERGGYAVVVVAEPVPDAEGRAKLEACLRTGLVSSATPRDPKWSDAEAEARWNGIAPPSSQMKLGKLVRTAHFLVMSNASGADRYGKTLEERYATLKKELGFAEVPTQRLLPVFYLRTGDEMRSVVLKNLGIADHDDSVDSFAEDDYLITSADSDDEMEETADLVDDLWRNRLRASGGGVWLRRGTMELLGYPDSNRTITASQLKKRRFTPLSKLLDSATWGARSNTEMPYAEQCAFFVEYLRESKGTKDVYPALQRAIGALPPDDPAWTQDVLASFLKSDLPTIEKNWIDYCAKRKK